MEIPLISKQEKSTWPWRSVLIITLLVGLGCVAFFHNSDALLEETPVGVCSSLCKAGAKVQKKMYLTRIGDLCKNSQGVIIGDTWGSPAPEVPQLTAEMCLAQNGELEAYTCGAAEQYWQNEIKGAVIPDSVCDFYSTTVCCGGSVAPSPTMQKAEVAKERLTEDLDLDVPVEPTAKKVKVAPALHTKGKAGKGTVNWNGYLMKAVVFGETHRWPNDGMRDALNGRPAPYQYFSENEPPFPGVPEKDRNGLPIDASVQLWSFQIAMSTVSDPDYACNTVKDFQIKSINAIWILLYAGKNSGEPTAAAVYQAVLASRAASDPAIRTFIDYLADLRVTQRADLRDIKNGNSDRFVKEQLVGSRLWPGDGKYVELLIAFLEAHAAFTFNPRSEILPTAEAASFGIVFERPPPEHQTKINGVIRRLRTEIDGIPEAQRDTYIPLRSQDMELKSAAEKADMTAGVAYAIAHMRDFVFAFWVAKQYRELPAPARGTIAYIQLGGFHAPGTSAILQNSVGFQVDTVADVSAYWAQVNGLAHKDVRRIYNGAQNLACFPTLITCPALACPPPVAFPAREAPDGSYGKLRNDMPEVQLKAIVLWPAIAQCIGVEGAVVQDIVPRIPSASMSIADVVE